jgi:hypothetical protein
MQEEIDTNGNFDNKQIPDGPSTFRILDVKKKYGKNDSPFYIWHLSSNGAEYDQVLMPNMMGGLLKALGYKETEKGKFVWDSDEVKGKTFVATVSHQPDKKDLNIIRQQMNDFKTDESIPF